MKQSKLVHLTVDVGLQSPPTLWKIGILQEHGQPLSCYGFSAILLYV
jgi:hypothetical protein